MVEFKNWKLICEEKDRRIEELENKFDEIVERLEKDYSQDVGFLKMISVDKAIEIVKGVKNELYSTKRIAEIV